MSNHWTSPRKTDGRKLQASSETKPATSPFGLLNATFATSKYEQLCRPRRGTRSEARSLLPILHNWKQHSTIFSASARSTKACSTARCKRWSWLAVSSTSPFFRVFEAHPQLSRRSTAALVHVRPTSPTRRSRLAIEAHPQLPQGSAAALVPAGRPSPQDSPSRLAPPASRPRCAPGGQRLCGGM